MKRRFSIIKDLFFAVLAFLSAAIILVVVMTAASTYFFPTTVQIVESHYAGNGIPSVGETAASPEMEDSATAQIDIPQPAVEPDAVPDEAAPDNSDGSGPVVAVGSAAPGEEMAETGSPPAAAGESAEVPIDMIAEARPDLSGASAGELENILERGEILPLGDGRVAYRVQSGDTFSQICKKVLGTGNAQIWRRAAKEMEIDYRRIRPGMVLIFGPEVIDAAKEYLNEGEG